jgi:hypothetical protein
MAPISRLAMNWWPWMQFEDSFRFRNQNQLELPGLALKNNLLRLISSSTQHLLRLDLVGLTSVQGTFLRPFRVSEHLQLFYHC